MKKLKEQFPLPNRIIKITIDGEVIETTTYNHFGNLMIELKDGNVFFAGIALKILNQDSEWEYID